MEEEGDLMLVHLDSPERYGGEPEHSGNESYRYQGERDDVTGEEDAAMGVVVDHPPQREQDGKVYGQTVGHMEKAEGAKTCFKPIEEAQASCLARREQGDKAEKDRQDDGDDSNPGREASGVGGEEEQGKKGAYSLEQLLPSYRQRKTGSELEEPMVSVAEPSASSQRDNPIATGERKENEAEDLPHGDGRQKMREKVRTEEDGEEDKDGMNTHRSIATGDSSAEVRKTYARHEYGITPPPELLRLQEELCRLAKANPVAASSLALDAHDTWRVQRAAAETDDLINQRKRLLSHRLPLEEEGASTSSPGREKKRKTIREERNDREEDQKEVAPSTGLSTTGTHTEQTSRTQGEGDGEEDGEEKKRRRLKVPETTGASLSVEERQAEDSSVSRDGEDTQINKDGHLIGDGFRHKDGDFARKQQKRIREVKEEDLQQARDSPLKKAQVQVEDEGGFECSSPDYYDSECDSMYGELLDLQPEDEQVQKHLLGDTNYNALATGNDFMSLVDAWRSIQQLCRSGEGNGDSNSSGTAHVSEEEKRALRSQLYKQLAPQSWNDSIECYCAVCNTAKEEKDAGPMLVCEGYCQRAFHSKCVGLEGLSLDLTSPTVSPSPDGGGGGADRSFSFHCEDCCDEVIKCSCCGLRKPRRQVARCSHMLCRRFFCWPSCVEKIPHISPFQPGPFVPSPPAPELLQRLVQRRGGKCSTSLMKELQRYHQNYHRQQQQEQQSTLLQTDADVGTKKKKRWEANDGERRQDDLKQREEDKKERSPGWKDSENQDERESWEERKPHQQQAADQDSSVKDCCDGLLPFLSTKSVSGMQIPDQSQKAKGETPHRQRACLDGSAPSDVNSSRLVEAARTLYDVGEEVFFDAQGRERFICARHFCSSCYALECQHFTWETQLRQVAQLADDLYLPLPPFFKSGGGAGKKKTPKELQTTTACHDGDESQVVSSAVEVVATSKHPSLDRKNEGKLGGKKGVKKRGKKASTEIPVEEQNERGDHLDSHSSPSQQSLSGTFSQPLGSSSSSGVDMQQKDKLGDEPKSLSSSSSFSSSLVSCSSASSSTPLSPWERGLEAVEQRISFARACFEFAKEATKGWTDKRIFSKQYKPLRPDPFPNLLLSPLVDIWECHSCSASFCGRCVPPASKILNDALGAILCDFCRVSKYTEKRNRGRFEGRSGTFLTGSSGQGSSSPAIGRRRKLSKKKKGSQHREAAGFIPDELINTIVDGAECITSLTNNMLRHLNDFSSPRDDDDDSLIPSGNTSGLLPPVSVIEKNVWETCELEEETEEEVGPNSRRRGRHDASGVCRSSPCGAEDDVSLGVQETISSSSSHSRRRVPGASNSSSGRRTNTPRRLSNNRNARRKKGERSEKENGDDLSTNDQDDDVSDEDDDGGVERGENGDATRGSPVEGVGKYKRKYSSAKQQKDTGGISQEKMNRRTSQSPLTSPPASSSSSSTTSSSLDNRLNFQFITSCVYPAHCRNLLRAPRTEGCNEVCVCSGNRCEGDCLNRSRGIQCDRRRCRFGAMDCGNRQFKRMGGGGGSSHGGTAATCGYNLCYVKECGPEKGLGVFAREKIEEGKLVVEYVGEVLDSQLLALRMRAYSEQELRKGKKQHWYVMEVMPHVYIDSTRVGNIARLVNHSCEPNCTLQRVSVHGTYRMGIFALRPILPGEEISYDYGFTRKGFGQGFICFCGSSRCRGRIGGDSRRNKFISVADNCLKRKEGFDHLLCRQLCQVLTSQNFSRAERIPPPSPYTWRRDGISTSAQARQWLEKRLLEAENSNPFFAQFIFDFHLYDASVNFVKLLLLDGKTVEEYARSKTKTLCMDIPWSLLASDFNDKVLVQATRHSILTEERLNKAKKFFLSNMAIRAAAVSGRSAQTALQDLVDLNWGSTEMCSLCDSEGVVSVCDACAEAYHADCAELSQDDQGRSLCPACLLSDSRRQWHLMNEAERMHVGVRLNALRLLETVAGSAYQQEYRLARQKEMSMIMMTGNSNPKTGNNTSATLTRGVVISHQDSNSPEAAEGTPTISTLYSGGALPSQTVGGGAGGIGKSAGTIRHHPHHQISPQRHSGRPVLAGLHVNDIWESFTLQEEEEALFFETGYIEE